MSWLKINFFMLTFMLMFTNLLPAQDEENFYNSSVGIISGYYQPSEKSWSDIYKSGGMTFGIFLEYCFTTRIAMDIQAKYFQKSGEMHFSSPIEEDIPAYKTKFEMMPIEFSLLYFLPYRQKNKFFLGGGVSYNYYRENLRKLNQQYEGANFGGHLSAGFKRILSEKLSLSVMAKYSYVSVEGEKYGAAGNEVQIGGLELSLILSKIGHF